MHQQFDVFLSHNSKDKPIIRQIKKLLVKRGLSVWLDEDELQPGRNWMPLLEKAINQCRSAGTFVGSDGIGSWEDEEVQSLLVKAVKNKIPVIPVLLPGKYKKPELPLFLDNRTYIDMRSGLEDEVIGKLIWGITGEKPEELIKPENNTYSNHRVSPIKDVYLKNFINNSLTLKGKLVWVAVFAAIGAYFTMTGVITDPVPESGSLTHVEIKGKVLDSETKNGIFNLKVSLPLSKLETTTNEFGEFGLTGEVKSFLDKEIVVLLNDSTQVISKKEITKSIYPSLEIPIKIP